MKRKKFLVVLFAAIMAVSTVFGLSACSSCGSGYTITANTAMPTMTVGNETPFVVTVGEKVDYTEYFIVKDKNGMTIVVTEDMLDLSQADTSMVGSFTVTLTVGGKSFKASFMVMPEGTVINPPLADNPEDLKAVLTKYSDSSKWNFAVNVLDSDNSGTYADVEEYYEYLGDLVLRNYTDDNNKQTTGYLEYVGDTLYCYLPDSTGKYAKYNESSTELENFYGYSYIIELATIGEYSFTSAGSYYTANDPSSAGNAILGDYGDSGSWTSFHLYVANGYISKIVAVIDFGSSGVDTITYTFSKNGQINFTLPKVDSSISTDNNNYIDGTNANCSAADSAPLQSAMKKTDGAIGLPSVGDYHTLVVPVQFSGNTISDAMLNKLNIAFNGTEQQTGWESVKTYYQKASYGKLNLSFDIQPVYKASKTASYYENYKESYKQDGETYTRTGEEVILKEVLAYYESRIDLTNYDTNGDGAIDAVYLVYSAPVDYSDDSFYWAYVTWFYGSEQYDGMDAYYYMFTGFDFMDEDLDKFDGMIVNAETYIHETGHLLGLDDYYDYDEKSGSNEGLGGADMMDYNKGDHGVYSKTMLGWLTPTVVSTTQTVTISSSQEKGDAILVPLNYNDTYFSEYLMIDLYSAKGLNEMASKMDETILYGGAAYGVRIYHVSSSADNPYSDTNYGSYTDNNNSTSDTALIKLIEADGYTKFSDTKGTASETDLWKAGQSLNSVFPNYKNNAGTKLNFNVTIVSVSAKSATITITYNK